MTPSRNQPPDDPSSAPESGTIRDDTSGNQPAAPNERPPQAEAMSGRKTNRPGDKPQKDDPSVAGEER